MLALFIQLVRHLIYHLLLDFFKNFLSNLFSNFVYEVTRNNESLLVQLSPYFASVVIIIALSIAKMKVKGWHRRLQAPNVVGYRSAGTGATLDENSGRQSEIPPGAPSNTRENIDDSITTPQGMMPQANHSSDVFPNDITSKSTPIHPVYAHFGGNRKQFPNISAGLRPSPNARPGSIELPVIHHAVQDPQSEQKSREEKFVPVAEAITSGPGDKEQSTYQLLEAYAGSRDLP